MCSCPTNSLRELNSLRHDFEQVRQHLKTDVIDAFFLEYVYPVEDLERVEAVNRFIWGELDFY